MTEQKSFVYSGKLEAMDIFNNFVSKKQYTKFEIHGGPSYTTPRLIEDGRNLVMTRLEREKREEEANKPWWIDETFGYYFANFIQWIFF